MNILVPIKRVIDYKVPVRVKPDHSGVVTENVKMSLNPFDEIALEEAIRLKEKGVVSKITAVTIGSSVCQDILRQAYALGVDEAILVNTDKTFEPLAIANILKAIAEKTQAKLVIMGKQAIDDDNNQTGQILAAKLGWPQGCFTSELNLEDEHALVTREVDAGLETLKLKLPAVITTDLRLNEPRLAKLPDIMKAKSKKIETLNIEDLNVALPSNLEILETTPPRPRQKGEMLASVDELVEKLKGIL
jgi:electron transfer flavoprotein beta subunit